MTTLLVGGGILAALLTAVPFTGRALMAIHADRDHADTSTPEPIPGGTR